MDRLISDGARIQAWIHERSLLPIQRDFHGVAREVDGQIVAAFGYDSFQSWCCALHAATDSPRGFNKALLRMAFWVPFVQWRFTTLIGIIQSSNPKSLWFAERLGFKEFASVEDADSANGLKFFLMRREECRWLMPGTLRETKQ